MQASANIAVQGLMVVYGGNAFWATVEFLAATCGWPVGKNWVFLPYPTHMGRTGLKYLHPVTGNKSFSYTNQQYVSIGHAFNTDAQTYYVCSTQAFTDWVHGKKPKICTLQREIGGCWHAPNLPGFSWFFNELPDWEMRQVHLFQWDLARIFTKKKKKPEQMSVLEFAQRKKIIQAKIAFK